MLPTQLFHYSPRELGELNPEFYEKYKLHWPEQGAMKPTGLWVSIEEPDSDTSWYDWCKAEQFRLDSLRYKYKVTLDSNSNILHLKSPGEIRQFSIQYAANDPLDFGRTYGRKDPYVYMINWLQIKSQYDGIFISPYQWDCRFCSIANWYYPWDCSSGCIWSLDKVKLTLDSMIDVEAIKDKEESEELVEVEKAKDLRWEDLGRLA